MAGDRIFFVIFEPLRGLRVKKSQNSFVFFDLFVVFVFF